MQADADQDMQRGEFAFEELKTAMKMVMDRDLTARLEGVNVQLARIDREYDTEIHVSTFTWDDGVPPVSGNRYVFHEDGRVEVTSAEDGHGIRTVIDGLLNGVVHLLRHVLAELRSGSPRENGGLKRAVRSALKEYETRTG